ncbi:hypothetical protein I3760_02G019100 [Carya illinoinensis]|uniref:ZF-HD dimerization-type domain-containing protein n=1 Tax=Carya illinoinensis TaxID=32201 RepID=A0A922FMQ1_CARIL|nr:hypothetical protein I3760_02G019100 [Carya illinoinensis]KAG6725173.1 hypothetical protein I3842_02G018700 [Carya illinoinensis]
MELIEGGLDEEVRLPSTVSYNPSHIESTKLSSPILASTEGETRRDRPVDGNTIVNLPQTLEHPRLYLDQQPDPHPHEQDTHKPRRDPDPNLDPVPSLASSGTIKSARTSTSTAIRASPNSPKVRYRECWKNHAASTGGHVVDGCGEFMSSAGEEGTPEALKCAACECHRSFHRKEVEGDSQYVSNTIYYTNPNINNGKRSEVVRPSQHHPPLPPSLPHVYHHHHQYHKFPHVPSTNPMVGTTLPMMMAFGGGGGVPAESSSEDLNMFRSNNIVAVGVQTSGQAQQSRKRFRTKFTQEQKDKMTEFAEKLEWKIQKHDEQQVQQFCSEVGVKRQVFKVWMHNNKQAMKKSKSEEN